MAFALRSFDTFTPEKRACIPLPIAKQATPDPYMRYHADFLGFSRITMDPEVMGGKSCIRGMPVTVGMILESLAADRTVPELLADFPYLEEQDVREALAFAARLAQGREIRLAS